jgi:hypothetical protein
MLVTATTMFDAPAEWLERSMGIDKCDLFNLEVHKSHLSSSVIVPHRTCQGTSIYPSSETVTLHISAHLPPSAIAIANVKDIQASCVVHDTLTGLTISFRNMRPCGLSHAEAS